MIKDTIGIIGCGVMGQAFLERLLKDKVAIPKKIIGCERNRSKIASIKRRFSIQLTSSLEKTIQKANIIFLVVKPHQSDAVISQMVGLLRSSDLVVSFMAGIGTKVLSRKLNHPYIIRAMPNTPGQIGAGITAWYSPFTLNHSQKSKIDNLLKSMGQTIFVRREEDIDKITAISASGPAYYYYTTEIIEMAAKKLSLSKSKVTKLVEQTFFGSAQLLNKSQKSATKLRREVTSKGGTTEAALKVLKKSQFSKIWEKAIKEAYQKAKKLGK